MKGNKKILDEDGNEVWEGYCIDLTNKLAELMDFDYELVTTYDYGKRDKNGSWDGLVGLLAYAVSIFIQCFSDIKQNII